MAKCKNDQTPVMVANKKIGIEFDCQLRSRVVRFEGSVPVALGDFSDAHYVTVTERNTDDCKFQSAVCGEMNDKFGHGYLYTVTGKSGNLEKKVLLRAYEKFPSTIFMKTQYRNTGTSSIKISGWVNGKYSISAKEQENPFWSFQGASYEERPDWVFPLKNGYYRKNFMGMNNEDYGGGIPVCDVWAKDGGLAVGHCSPVPELVSLPVRVNEGTATLSVCLDRDLEIEPGKILDTIETFVMLHEGDFFGTLTTYRRIMELEGLKFAPINQEAYEPAWCSWGYERDFQVEQIYKALPMVKKLGFKWICLDDGWQNEEGDYLLSKDKFPDGEEGIKKFVRRVHEQGFKVQLWWIPMACDPKSIYYSQHPESVILDKYGNKQQVTWWDNYYLCPACDDVKEHTRNTVRKILKDWDFDGLKIDGQHLNAAPLCYNKAHHHKRPEDSYEAVPDFFKLIYEEAKRIKPNALIMFCPCGTCYSIYTMPYFDMPVASDPESSWQVRSKGKVFKALMNGDIPYNGDHVELSDDECDFASTIGIGAVINTKFTWPVGSSPVSIVKEGADFDLDEKKEAVYRKWIAVYREKMLSKGKYLGNLYSFGFDVPECHAIKKDGKMYYAFYADSYKGEVELRGLDSQAHIVYDYVNDRLVAKLAPGENKIRLEFQKSSLIEVNVYKT